MVGLLVMVEGLYLRMEGGLLCGGEGIMAGTGTHVSRIGGRADYKLVPSQVLEFNLRN